MKIKKKNHYLDLNNSLEVSNSLYFEDLKSYLDNLKEISYVYFQDRRYFSLFSYAFSCSEIKGHFLLQELHAVKNISTKSIERYVNALCEVDIIKKIQLKDDGRISAYEFTISESLEKIFLRRQLADIKAITKLTEEEYKALENGINRRLTKLEKNKE
jgi:hypothetical protein